MNPLWPGLGLAVLVLLIWSVGRISTSRPVHPASIETSAVHVVRREGLSGGLAQMPLSEVLQYLAVTGASGTLTVSSGRRTGRVQFGKGRIVDADFRRETRIPALYALLALDAGDFRFDASAHPAQTPQGLEVLDLVMTWMESTSQGGVS